MAGIPGAHRRAHTPPLRALHRRSCTWSRSRTRTAACPEASRSGSKGSCVPLYRTASYSLIQAPFPLGFDRVGALRVLFWAYDQGRRHRQRVQQSRVLEEGIRRDRRDGVRHGEGHAGARREDQALGIRQLRRAREEIARRPQPADGPGDRDFRPPCTDVPAFASAEERPEQAGLRRGSPIDGRRTGCYDAAPAEPYRGVAQPGSALAWGASGRWFKSSRPDQLKAADSPRETVVGSAAFDFGQLDPRLSGAPFDIQLGLFIDAALEAEVLALDERLARLECLALLVLRESTGLLQRAAAASTEWSDP